MLYTDIPTDRQLATLDALRGDACVSIYLPTTRVTSAAAGDRILFKNLAADAVSALAEAGTDKRLIWPLEAEFAALHDDDDFWTTLADGLAVFATPDALKSFRLPMAPKAEVQVSDRLHLKPLLPLITFPTSCFVLALSQGATRFIEVTESLAEPIKVDGLPRDMSHALKKRFPRDPAPSGRIQGGEGMNVLIGSYCRIIDRALSRTLAGQARPLVLAAVDDMAAQYRAKNTYPHLLDATISGNPEQISTEDLARAARALAGDHAQAVVRDRVARTVERLGRGLASADLSDIARAAAQGRIATLLVDLDADQPGRIDPDSGALDLADRADAESYDVLDKVARMTVAAGGTVVPVTADDLPGDSRIAALYRYAL